MGKRDCRGREAWDLEEREEPAFRVREALTCGNFSSIACVVFLSGDSLEPTSVVSDYSLSITDE